MCVRRGVRAVQLWTKLASWEVWTGPMVVQTIRVPMTRVTVVFISVVRRGGYGYAGVEHRAPVAGPPGGDRRGGGRGRVDPGLPGRGQEHGGIRSTRSCRGGVRDRGGADHRVRLGHTATCGNDPAVR